ncbi:MAG TPA: carbohydrate ABC transporter permease [Candidatus Borkfalkia stercoripullorum]|nr:carbohydrate ABC transporter permease [Candidatus Borkfalkia stercoripullorum]
MEKTMQAGGGSALRETIVGIVLRIFTYIILIIGAAFLVMPYLWMLLGSFKAPLDANALEFRFFPQEWIFTNYTDLFTSPNFPIVNAFFNTVLVEVSVIVVGTFVSAMAAFSFAKLKLPHKTFWLLFLMSGMMVPYAALMLPQFRVFQTIGMFDTLWPLILPGFFGNVSMLFFLVQYMRGIPNAYFEAARIDGAGHFTCFIRIMLPLVKTAIAAQVIFWFIGIWNDYFAPSIYLITPGRMTLQALLGSLNPSMNRQYLPMALAGAVLSSIPMFVIYLSCQKFFIESLAISGVKG